nr:hypothetical protein [uncultured Undibacterium sp.]
MRFYLFDQILETHVCTALERSLVKIGHQVIASGKVWAGHRFPTEPVDIARIDLALEQVIAARPDVLFNFRASTLLPQQIARLRSAGIRTMVWQPDDPVLYDICYSRIMDHYDDVFLCASRRVIDFYRYRGHKSAINMPFWVDTDRYTCVPHQKKLGDVVFLGNGVGKVRQARYATLCDLTENITLYGQYDNDPAGKVRAYLSEDEIIHTIGQYRLSINLPQSFDSYAQTGYDFAGLGLLGQFFLPSRVVQYAALGLPTLTIQASNYDPMHYPPGLHARNFAQAKSLIATTLASPERLELLSKAARQYAVRHLDADSRAALLDAVCRGTIRAQDLSDYEQNYIYKWIL